MSEQGEAGTHDATVGERLGAARAAAGLQLADVAARTRIPMRHLAAIEAGDHAALPAATYSTGFVKTYARLLGLDGVALSQDFRAEMGGAAAAPRPTASYAPADPRRTPPAGLALLALLVAVVAGLGYLYWRGSAAESPTTLAATTQDQPVLAVHKAPPAAATPAPASQGAAVVIGATQEVWIKVADGGKTLFMGTLKPADHYQVPADAAAPLLTTGRPGVTTITVGATPIPPVGDPDRAARDVSLKADALLARVATPPPAVQPAPGAPTPVGNGAT